MRCDVECLVERCVTCHQANSKVNPCGLYTPLTFPSAPSIDSSMDFTHGLPCSKKDNDSIYVVVDWFSK